jgi:hypothetical protein
MSCRLLSFSVLKLHATFLLMILIHSFFTSYIFSRYRVDWSVPIRIRSQSEKLHCIYFGFFICSSNRNISHLTKLIFHHLSGWTEHFGIYLHKNQQMHQNYHFIVMLNISSYMFRRISVIIRELTRSSQATCRCILQK